jgi:hypothetical protein
MSMWRRRLFASLSVPCRSPVCPDSPGLDKVPGAVRNIA